MAAQYAKVWRGVCALVCGLIVLASLVLAAYSTSTYRDVLGGRGGLKTRPYGAEQRDDVKAATDGRIKATEGCRQIVLGLLVVVWGLVIAKPDETRLLTEDLPELVMFVGTHVAVAAFLVVHFTYILLASEAPLRVVGFAGEKRILDLFSGPLDTMFMAQLWLTLFLALSVAILLSSAHLLKERKS